MGYTAPQQYVTASDYLNMVTVFRSILLRRGPDEPQQDGVDGYNPLRSAGFFGLDAAVDTLIVAREQYSHVTCKRETPSERAITAALPVATQLLFALLDDADALAGTVRYLRTGDIGHATSADRERVPALVEYLRKLVNFSEDFNRRALANDWTSPLERTVYPYPGPSRIEKLPVERIVELETE